MFICKNKKITGIRYFKFILKWVHQSSLSKGGIGKPIAIAPFNKLKFMQYWFLFQALPLFPTWMEKNFISRGKRSLIHWYRYINPIQRVNMFLYTISLLFLGIFSKKYRTYAQCHLNWWNNLYFIIYGCYSFYYGFVESMHAFYQGRMKTWRVIYLYCLIGLNPIAP